MAEQQPPPPEERAGQVAAVIAGAAVAGGTVAAAAGAVAATAAILARLTRLWLSWGWSRRAVRTTLRITTEVLTVQLRLHVTGGRPDGPALAGTVRDELTFTGWFLERVGTRVEAAVRAAEAAGTSVDDAVADAEARERRWLEAHERAQEGRRAAAEAVDAEAAKPGTLDVTTPGTGPRNADGGTPGDPDGILEQRPRKIVAWVTVNDDRATPECVAADGCWFYADTPPIIGYPGQPHGATCRCTPGPATAAMFVSGRHVNEAVAEILEPGHRNHPGAARPSRPRRPRAA